MERKDNNLTQYPHLVLYRDVKPEIDKGLMEVDFLLGYQKTYFSAQGNLRSALARLEDPNYLEKIKKFGTPSMIEERNRALPYKDKIANLIEKIDFYETENNKLINALIEKGSVDEREFSVLYPYLKLLAEDNAAHDRIPRKLVDFFCKEPSKTRRFNSCDLRIICNYLMLQIKAKGRYYFAYPYIADELVDLIAKADHLSGTNRAEMLVEAGDYYLTACQRSKAMECYCNAAVFAKDEDNLENAAYAMQKYYRVNQAFPEDKRVQASVDDIKREYDEYANIVLAGIFAQVAKVDPVEFSDEFAEIFQTVMQLVEEEIDRVGDLHLPYQRWNLMEKYFAEHNIVWKNPKQMNPNIIFD